MHKQSLNTVKCYRLDKQGTSFMIQLKFHPWRVCVHEYPDMHILTKTFRKSYSLKPLDLFKPNLDRILSNRSVLHPRLP